MTKFILFFAAAGLALLSLTGGVRDALNVLLYDKEFLAGSVQTFGYVTADGVIVSEFENGKRIRTYRTDKDSVDLNAQGMLSAGEINENILKVVYSFTIPPDYVLAAGCALKGFVPELHSANFLPSATAKKTQNETYKNLFHRTVFASGGLPKKGVRRVNFGGARWSLGFALVSLFFVVLSIKCKLSI